ncbi:MAG: Nucleotide-binding protein implicated in inhibition of septum formation [Pseudomonadota bacterium]
MQASSTQAIQTNTRQIILASGSAYRKELLQRLRLPFEVISPDIDESSLPDETPVDTAMRLAQAKTEKIAEQTKPALVIGSDQVATLDNHQIGKPGNHANALAQLQMMRGRSVVFHTALCLIDTHPTSTKPLQIENIQTVVTFRDLPDAELDAYLKIEQPYDCAGSAKNEGLGITLIAAIEGTDPTALTGLPLIALTSMLHNCGVSFF